MFSTILKFLWHTGAALFWGALLLSIPIWAIGYMMASGCAFDEYEQLYSPDKTMRAVVIIADCGATTNWQTQIFVEKVDGSRTTDNLIRLDGHPKDIDCKMTWISQNKLLISDFDFDQLLGFKNQSWGDFVEVEFKVKGDLD